MCGIIGIVDKGSVAPSLIEALGKLEYRGYDSSGIATIEDGSIRRIRAEGKIVELARRVEHDTPRGCIGIGHTRWATHGEPAERNAHPHATPRVALVHNGIIENHAELRAALEARGRVFESETDTEVVVQLVDEGLSLGLSPRAAMESALANLRGSYAVAAIFRDHDDLLVAARVGSPLVVGVSATGSYVASDPMAIAPWVRRVAYLEDGDVVEVHRGTLAVAIAHPEKGARRFHSIAPAAQTVDKGGFPHFMRKEIEEQPAVLRRAIERYVTRDASGLVFPDTAIDLGLVRRVSIVACGTSYYAGLTARRWFERIAKVPVDLDVASEFRYRDAPHDPRTLTVVVSQSGETADTLAAMRHVRGLRGPVVAIVNVESSTIAREADLVLPTCAGPEIGVASTKAYTTQLVTLAVLALRIARARGALDDRGLATELRKLVRAPELVEDALACEPVVRRIAAGITDAHTVLFVGRGTSHALALEGALKLKEISYLHAEAFAAGELKHGPLALVDASTPVVVIAPPDELFEKTMSNAQEIAARRGILHAFTEAEGVEAMSRIARSTVVLPDTDALTAPLVHAIPLQLLAYHVAILRGTDVDRPRNLAKSVTVE